MRQCLETIIICHRLLLLHYSFHGVMTWGLSKAYYFSNTEIIRCSLPAAMSPRSDPSVIFLSIWVESANEFNPNSETMKLLQGPCWTLSHLFSIVFSKANKSTQNLLFCVYSNCLLLFYLCCISIFECVTLSNKDVFCVLICNQIAAYHLHWMQHKEGDLDLLKFVRSET